MKVNKYIGGHLSVIVLLLLGFSVHASTGAMIQVSGKLLNFDTKKAELRDEKGIMKVPIGSIDVRHMVPGQWVTVTVDFVDFYRMNPGKFKQSNAKTD